jgi:hypothetical protein
MPLLHLAQKQTEHMPEFNKTGWSIPFLYPPISLKKKKYTYFTCSLANALTLPHLLGKTHSLYYTLVTPLSPLISLEKHNDFTTLSGKHTDCTLWQTH